MSVFGLRCPLKLISSLSTVRAASQTLSERLRHVYFASVLVQDAAFFDNVGPGEISTRASKDIEAIRIAFGEKLGFVVWTFSTVAVVGSPNVCGDPS